MRRASTSQPDRLQSSHDRGWLGINGCLHNECAQGLTARLAAASMQRLAAHSQGKVQRQMQLMQRRWQPGGLLP